MNIIQGNMQKGSFEEDMEKMLASVQNRSFWWKADAQSFFMHGRNYV